MANPAALLIIGGGALFLMGGKKKRRSSSSKSKTSTKSDVGKALPGLEDEDMDKEEGASVPSPTPSKPSTPSTPSQPLPSPSEPFGKPSIGPTGVGTCVNSIYNRDPEYMTPDVLTANGAMSIFQESDYFFYIRRDFQKKIYDYMLKRFMNMKNGHERQTVASVVLREALKHFNSGCDWQGPIDTLSEPEKAVWDGGRRLAIMAQVTAGVKDPGYDQLFRTGNRFVIHRASLGEPDPGFMGSNEKSSLMNRRVEFIATDETQENAEHVFGEIVRLTGPNNEPNLFEVRVVETFQGVDVSPRLRSKHGFKVGSNLFLSQQGPTGLYRIYQEGMN